METRRIFLISRATIVIVFLALLRCIAEIYQLRYAVVGDFVSILEPHIVPYLHGAAVCSLSLFIMTILFFYKKSSAIIFIGAFTIIGLFVIKYVFIK